MDPRDTEARLFFIHVMKTAGTTFSVQLRGASAPDAIYPGPDDPRRSPVDLDHLASLRADRRARIRAYTGLFPFVASEIVRARNREVSTGPLITATVVRDPVQRTLSVLRQQQRFSPDRSLEEIYEDPATFVPLIRDHAAKVFSLRVTDPGPSVLTELVVDDERLRSACRNLESVDVIGRIEEYPRFVAQVQARLGWQLPAPGRARANPATEAPPRSLVERIRRDNPADVAFHEVALDLVARRSMLDARRSCQLNGFSRWRGRPVATAAMRSPVPKGWVRGHDGTATVPDHPAGDVLATPAIARPAASPSR